MSLMVGEGYPQLSLTSSGVFPVGFDLTKSTDALPPIESTTLTTPTEPPTVDIILYQRTKGSSWQKIESGDKVRVTAGGKENKKASGRILQAHFLTNDPRFSSSHINLDGVMAVDANKKVVVENLEVQKVIPATAEAPLVVELKVKTLCKRMTVCASIRGASDTRAYIYSCEFEAHNDGNKGKQRKEKTNGNPVIHRTPEEIEQECEELSAYWGDEEKAALNQLTTSSSSATLCLFLKLFREIQEVRSENMQLQELLSSVIYEQQTVSQVVSAQQQQIQQVAKPSPELELRLKAQMLLKDILPYAKNNQITAAVTLYWRKELLPDLKLRIREEAPNTLFENEQTLSNSSNVVYIRSAQAKNYYVSVELPSSLTAEQLIQTGAFILVFDMRRKRPMIMQNLLKARSVRLEAGSKGSFWKIGILSVKKLKINWNAREDKLSDDDYN
eukprot:TRINITY_DN16410_c0_g1_i1.p1 TRINITY_DN16410_c0_g1~~TRINITY_DN16410_c0_g1_i1.p1  ORF type:complete len:444 (-),score=104.94 TRINITY_DN16410_c0_g1_i1:76-1407(-)